MVSNSKTERSNLIATSRKRRAAPPTSTPEIAASEGSPTERSDPGSSTHSVIKPILRENTDPPCFPPGENLPLAPGQSNLQAPPEHIHKGQSSFSLPGSPPSGCGSSENLLAEIHPRQNAPTPPCPGVEPPDSGAQGTLCHSPGDNAHASYDHEQNGLSSFDPGVRAPVNFVGRQSGDLLEVPAGLLSPLGLSTGNGGPEVKTQEPPGSTQLGVRSGAPIHRGPSAPSSSESILARHHSEETSNLAVESCEQATPEITHPRNPMSLLLQPFHSTPREPPDDLVSTLAFASTGSNPSSRVFLQMENISREVYRFGGEWLNSTPSSTPSLVLSFDSPVESSPPMPFCQGATSPGSVSLHIQGWETRAEVHSSEKAAPASQSTPCSNLSSISSPYDECSSIGVSALTGQEWAPISIKGLEDYGGPSDQGEDQIMTPSKPHVGVFSNCSTENSTVYYTPAAGGRKWLNISGLEGEEGGEEVYWNPPHDWWEAGVFSYPLQALNKPVDEEILRRNDTARKHPEDVYKPLEIPPCQAGNTIPDTDQSWRKIKLPLVTFRGPWQDVPDPDEDAMGGKYYGEILYSCASPKQKPISAGLDTPTPGGLPISNSASTIPEGKQQAVKPLSIIERRMAKQRAGVRKSSRTKNPSLKK